MNRMRRIVSVGSCAVTAILIGPSLLSAQISRPPSSQTPISGIAAFAIFVTLLVILGASVKVHDTKRKGDEQGLYLHPMPSWTIRSWRGSPLACTVRVPFWRPAAARVVVSGRVPTRKLREAAIRLVLDRTFAAWPRARIEDRIVIEPQTIRHAA